MQYYNSGSMLGCDGKVYSQGSVDFLTALACIQLENGLRPDQVSLGLPAGPLREPQDMGVVEVGRIDRWVLAHHHHLPRTERQSGPFAH